MNLAVILPAAGASRRFHESAGPLADDTRSKLDEMLGGRPVLQRTVELFNKIPEVALIIVAGPADPDAYKAFCDRHADRLSLLGCRFCQGGQTHRYETVRNALDVAREHVPDATHIAVHDAARPCASNELVERVLLAARTHDAVIPGVDVPDTLKRVGEAVAGGAVDPIDSILGADTGPSARLVEATVDRTNVVAVQTPQVYKADLLYRAYEQDDLTSTDDAQLIERMGEPVAVVPGDVRNIKITVAPDVTLARNILGLREEPQRATHKKF